MKEVNSYFKEPFLCSESLLRLLKLLTQPRAELVGLHRVMQRHSHAGCILKSADGALVRGAVRELKRKPDRFMYASCIVKKAALPDIHC